MHRLCLRVRVFGHNTSPSILCLTKLLVIFKPPSIKLCSREAWSVLTPPLPPLSLSRARSLLSLLSLYLCPVSLSSTLQLSVSLTRVSVSFPSCCLSLLLSPLPFPLSLFQGSNEYLSRPCSITWENAHTTHVHTRPGVSLSVCSTAHVSVQDFWVAMVRRLN